MAKKAKKVRISELIEVLKGVLTEAGDLPVFHVDDMFDRPLSERIEVRQIRDVRTGIPQEERAAFLVDLLD